jgi:recombination protein RecT
MANDVAVKQFTTTISSDAVKMKVNAIIGDEKKGAKFISYLTNMVTQNPSLAECEQSSVINSALVGFALGLEHQLGHFHVVPFNDRKNNRKVATYQMGYKGYIALAIRSGQYKSLNAIDVKQGELKKYDRLADEVEIDFIQDDVKREQLETVGYVALLELHTGFKKTIYWSKAKMQQHAVKYSQGYQNDVKNGSSYTFWSKDFDGMAFKTMLRQLISKWGIMSVEIREAFVKDQVEVDDTGKTNYVDNPQEVKAQVLEIANKKEVPADISGLISDTGEVKEF